MDKSIGKIDAFGTGMREAGQKIANTFRTFADKPDEEYIAWRRDKRNIISYVDHFCEITRTMYPEVPGYAQGYVNIDAVVLKVLRDGSARLDFKCFYDIRQYDKNMDGCYVTIEKID